MSPPWMWMSAIVVLCGAELDSEIEHGSALDTTGEAAKPRLARNTVKAETPGPQVPTAPKEH